MVPVEDMSKQRDARLKAIVPESGPIGQVSEDYDNYTESGSTSKSGTVSNAFSAPIKPTIMEQDKDNKTLVYILPQAL